MNEMQALLALVAILSGVAIVAIIAALALLYFVRRKVGPSLNPLVGSQQLDGLTDDSRQ